MTVKVLHHRGATKVRENVSLNQAAPVEAMFQRARRLDDIERQQGHPVTHVKNGKPLTPQGARMLGVPWP